MAGQFNRDDTIINKHFTFYSTWTVTVDSANGEGDGSVVVDWLFIVVPVFVGLSVRSLFCCVHYLVSFLVLQ